MKVGIAMWQADRILGTEVGSTAPLFLAILAVHVPAGLTAVLTGAGAALSHKGSIRHVRLGRWYYAAITVVFATATALTTLRWREDWPLLLLGALSFGAATLGYLHRARHRPGDDGHIAAMGASYALMLTAFYVDNGPHLPLWDRLPTAALYLLPGAIATPLTLRAIHHARGRTRANATADPAVRSYTMQRAESQAVHEELERVRADFHRLLESASPQDLGRPTNGTRWTNEQLLYHMLFGYMVTRALLRLVRLFGRLPDRASRGYARLLNTATTPFDLVNYLGSCAGARVYNHRRMAAKLDRVITALHRSLEHETARDLARGMHYPTRWDPFFAHYMTLADLYRYPAQHYDFHRRQLTLKLTSVV